MGANYPNPFNSGTVIPFDLAFDGDVRLSVYNLAGQRVRRLVNAPLTAGHHRLRWSGHDDDGRTLASGVYFYRLQSGARRETRKLILVQ